MPTVGQIADKISELRSKIAIHEGVLLYLESNYTSSDAGAAEMHFTRADYARVPEVHVVAYMTDVHETVQELRMELEHWENLAVPVGEPDEEPAAPIKKNSRKGKKSRGKTTRRHQDHTTPGDTGAAEAG